ncbi:MAG: hypothetical protein IPM35_14460 [Myxococcales bacterium]|nr:hypothetical protein [Myxococcales bacterium]
MRSAPSTARLPPRDRIIVATAQAHRATLVTADETLLDWGSSLRTLDAKT